MESGDTFPLLLWLMAYAGRWGLEATGCHPKKTSEEAKIERVPLACRRAGGVKVWQPTQPSGRATHSAGSKGTWKKMMAKLLSEDHAAVSVAAAATAVAG